MDALNARSGLVRLAGCIVWLAVGVFLPFCSDPNASPLATCALYLSFGGLFLLSSRDGAPALQRRHVALLAGQSLAALLLIVAHPYFLMTGLFVIVGWQVALSLPRTVGLTWITLQSLAAGFLLLGALPPMLLAASVGAAFGFQIFAMATAELVRSERAAQRIAAEALEALRHTQAELLQHARDEERLSIARDLHDELGHGLTALGLMAAATELAASDGATQGSAAALKRGAQELLDRVRSVVSTMRVEAGDGDLGGVVDLRQALQAISAHGNGPLRFEVTVSGDVSALPQAHAVTVLRLVQEAHTNALRHAGATATRFVVRITRTLEAIEIAAADDGVGAERIEFGNGLSGMRGRLQALGGTLDARSAPGEGFRISACLPMLAS